MARIAGIDIPREKRVEISLTYIYGVGPTAAKDGGSRTNCVPGARVRAVMGDALPGLASARRLRGWRPRCARG